MTDDEDIENHINVAAYFLANKNFPIDKLCWMYSERKLFSENDNQIATEEAVRSKSAEMFFSCCEYDIICWLISELEIKIGKKFHKAKRISEGF